MTCFTRQENFPQDARKLEKKISMVSLKKNFKGMCLKMTCCPILQTDNIRVNHKISEGRLQNLSLDQLDEVEDDEDEEIIRMFRDKRIAELKALTEKNKFGEVNYI